ncbi:hypothetical protein ABB37_00626 [Leptomonas pyrrhocoris]|uniref:Transmembrane protein n=1 Tax=Leptomonas pyrrhocoris TaxID=157538 RepID=A0A0N0E0I0_LEPPY|nr:hypothetical protein ABB37_00626 [Leptomonas pyrrhocoris]KPA86475.1 hypothetical protein ABB37_00626 [Leptomonas pyrrhocoris]|eukprot:XP_015664914.1 hypothetical protein ABB37_00626 [Leptomonas pyrrhocoris]
MMDFRDVTAENQIKGFSAYFDSINYPAQPLSAESKVFFNTFFGGEGFITLCDLLFGPYYDKGASDARELCWMDYANLAPTQSVATALSGLIHPNSAFISTLEALSTPSATFSARIKKGWKNAAEARLESFLYTDLPLSSVYPQSYQLMTEPGDSNLYVLPRSRVPPILLVPFWEPPVVTRKELSQQQILTSLPCSPIGYFVFRLFFFGMKRVKQYSGDYLAQRRRRNFFSCMWHLKEVAYASLFKTVPIDMPYYTQLLQTYTQIYVSPSLPRHLSSKATIGDVTWTTCDTVAALLIMAPSLLAHRQMKQPLDENTRFGCTNPESLAQITSIVPLHTSMVYALLQNRSDFPVQDSQFSVPPDFPLDASSKAQSDLESIGSTLYRNCLILLRECLLSLDLEPYCKSSHFTYCFELWAVLMHPFDKQQRPMASQHVLHHFEAFSFITVDVLNMLVKSSFCRSMNEESVKVLKKCFFLLSQDSVGSLLGDIHTSQTSPRSIADVVSRYFVLNWTGNDGNIQLPDLHGDTTCDLAARAYVLLERALSGDLSDQLKSDLREALSFMEKVFPNISTHLDAWRSAERSSFVASSSTSSRHVTIADRLSDSDRSLFFKGTKTHRKIFAKNIRLPTRNGRIPGGHHPALQTSLRNEIPLLLGVSRFLDAVTVKALAVYYSSLIPKCDNGHNLWLLYSKNYSCCNHPRETAIWECSLCETVYGSCCMGFPFRADGVRYLVCEASISDDKQCGLCGQVVPNDCSLFYPEHSRGIYVCPDCASQPFKAPSTRWIASYTTWATLVVAVMLYFVIVFLSN